MVAQYIAVFKFPLNHGLKHNTKHNPRKEVSKEKHKPQHLRRLPSRTPPPRYQVPASRLDQTRNTQVTVRQSRIYSNLSYLPMIPALPRNYDKIRFDLYQLSYEKRKKILNVVDKRCTPVQNIQIPV